MTVLSCLAIGLAFLLAVGLLLLAAVLLGWYVPASVEKARRLPSPLREDDKENDEEEADPSLIDPPEPRA